MPPDGYRNEGTPSLSEGPDARGVKGSTTKNLVGPKAAKVKKTQSSKAEMPNHPLQLNPQLRQLNTRSSIALHRQ
jgi:hypothetical protein